MVQLLQVVATSNLGTLVAAVKGRVLLDAVVGGVAVDDHMFWAVIPAQSATVTLATTAVVGVKAHRALVVPRVHTAEGRQTPVLPVLQDRTVRLDQAPE